MFAFPRVLSSVRNHRAVKNPIVLCPKVKLYCHTSVARDSSELTSLVECRRQNMQALRRMDDEVVKAKRLKQERDAQDDDDAANLHVSRRYNGGVCHCASITVSSLFVHYM